MGIGIGDVLTGLMGAGSVMQTVSAYQTAKSDKNAYNYQAGVDDTNAQLAEQARADAIRNGQIEAVNSGLKTAQLEGDQRARFSQANVDLNSGSPLNVLSDTIFMGKRDAAIIMDNANKRAWADEVQAGNYRSNAKLLRNRADNISPGKQALGTLLTTGGTVASHWYEMDRAENRRQTLG